MGAYMAKDGHIAIVTFSLSKITGRAALSPIADLIKIISSIYGDRNKIILISGGEILRLKAKNVILLYVKSIDEYKITSKNKVVRSIIIVLARLEILLSIISYIIKSILTYGTRIFIFTLGIEVFFPAVLTVKIFNKRAIIVLAGDIVEIGNIWASSRSIRGRLINNRINWMLSMLFSDLIIAYSPSFVKNKIRISCLLKKVRFAPHHIIDFNTFTYNENYGKNKYNIVGFVGRLTPEKNVVNLVIAFDNLIRSYKVDAKLFIIGDGILRNKIEEIIERRNLQDYVKIVGWVPREKLLSYYHLFKILVLPSYSEGLPYVVLEAMACGVPVLTSSVGSLPYIVKEGITGFLLEPPSASSIAKKLAIIIQDEEKLEKVRKTSYLYVKKNFSSENIISKWKNIFLELDRGYVI
jgi:glycosyltransferase involved in cell wall biosynthesis